MRLEVLSAFTGTDFDIWMPPAESEAEAALRKLEASLRWSVHELAEMIRAAEGDSDLQCDIAREYVDRLADSLAGIRPWLVNLLDTHRELEAASAALVALQEKHWFPLDADVRAWRDERFWATTSQAARAYGCDRSYIKKRAPELASAGNAYKHADGRWRFRYHAIRDLGVER